MKSSNSLLQAPNISVIINGNIVDNMQVYNISNNWYGTYLIHKAYFGDVSFLIKDYYNNVGNYGYSILKSSSITIVKSSIHNPYTKHLNFYSTKNKTTLNNKLGIVFSKDTYKSNYIVDKDSSFLTGFPLINSSTNNSSKIKKATYIRIYSK